MQTTYRTRQRAVVLSFLINSGNCHTAEEIIKALEEKGGLEVMSTPKLSTLNGHEAVLKSGETQYYKEVMNNIIGTQNPIQSESYTWKSLEANMTLRIVPFVSADSTITLDIEIEQSEFTAREEKSACCKQKHK